MKITALWQKRGKHFWLNMKILLANVLIFDMITSSRQPLHSCVYAQAGCRD